MAYKTCPSCGGIRNPNMKCGTCNDVGRVYDSTGKGDCFPGSAKVLTPIGWKNISEFSSNDEVVSLSKAGQIEIKRIIKLKLFPPNPIITLQTENCDIAVTRSHTLLTERGLLHVKNILPGDVLVYMNDQNVIKRNCVQSIIDKGVKEPVYNLIVQDNYTFAVKGCIAHSYSHFRTLRTLISQGLWGFHFESIYPANAQ